MVRIVRHMKMMRRKGCKDRKLPRKVFRQCLFKARYEGMRQVLENCKEPSMFGRMKPVEGRRAQPPMMKKYDTKVIKHEHVSDMIANLLNSLGEIAFPVKDIDIDIDDEVLN